MYMDNVGVQMAVLPFVHRRYFLEKRTRHGKDSAMKNTYQIQTLLELFYQDCNIPIYLYEENALVFCVPGQAPLTFPPKRHLDAMQNTAERVSYHATSYGIYYGRLRLDLDKPAFLVLGPASDIAFTESELHQMYADYVIPSEERKAFQDFMGKIPQTSLPMLLRKLVFLNYCLHGEVLDSQALLPSGTVQLPSYSNIAEESYQSKENLLLNKSYELESITMNLVRTGNVEGFKELQFNTDLFHIGSTGHTALRNIKNNIIITTTLNTRAAIDGGLDYDTAYRLSDSFIQKAEQIQDADGLYELLGKIGPAFAKAVSDAKFPATPDDCIKRAIQFIRQNINQPIGVTDVASCAGFSRSYFCAYFKRELGFSIGAFILRCRLEEGRLLLKHTDKPIGVISNYLCFSSQSHFQTAFKKQFGITPMQYRNSGKGT